jgi:hypothetical protein
VIVQAVPDLTTCTRPDGGFVIPGAKSPDWGPADVLAGVATPAPTPGAKRCIVPKLNGITLSRARQALARRTASSAR